MKMNVLLLLLIILLPTQAVAGDIYGNIRSDSEERVRIEVRCNEEIYSTRTDYRGYYRLYIPETGNCEITVRLGENWTEPRDLRIYGKAARYDWRIREYNGRYILDED